MAIRPNELNHGENGKTSNDLYRKYSKYFETATDRQFVKYGIYNHDAYVTVRKDIEEKIQDFLNNESFSIQAITGPTGIGKTFLLLHALEDHYKWKSIESNSAIVVLSNGMKDVFYYNDFSVTEIPMLDNFQKTFCCKLKAIIDRLEVEFPDSKVKDEEIYSLFNAEKKEILYYREDDKEYQVCLYKLIAVLNKINKDDFRLKNFVFVFDDLESLKVSKQSYVINFFNKLYENIITKCEGRYKVKAKFILCIRKKTFAKLYKLDSINTHRPDKPWELNEVPSLSDIFKARNRVAEKTDKSYPGNLDTWRDGTRIMISIADRIDYNYKDVLLALNNNNICNAISDYVKILKNRRFTQNDAPVKVSFIIEEGNYILSENRMLHALAMEENNVYEKNNNSGLRCILRNAGENIYEDIFSFYILKAFCKNDGRELSVGRIIEVFSSSMGIESDEKLFGMINRIIDYYADERFIHETEVFEEKKTEANEKTYYIMPRGKMIRHIFFDRTILFTIFRDDFLIDENRQNVMCSYKLSHEEQFIEAIRYYNELFKAEEALYDLMDEYSWGPFLNFFGRYSVANDFWCAIQNSIKVYYRDIEYPEPVKKELESAKDIHSHLKRIPEDVTNAFPFNLR